MAPAAADAAAGGPSLWGQLLAPDPGRAGFAIRLALCCTLTAFVALYYGTPEAALTTYLVLFINKPGRAATVESAVALTVLITLIVGILILLAKVTLANPAWRIFAMTALSLLLLFLASASKLKPVASTLALITAYALDLLGSVPDGELGTRGLLHAWLFVSIPAAVSLMMGIVLAPSPMRLAQGIVAQRLDAAAQAMRAPDPAQARALTRLLRTGDEELAGYLKLARHEDKAASARVGALARLADASLSLAGITAFMLSEPRAMLPPDIRLAAADAMERCAEALRLGKPEPAPFAGRLAESEVDEPLADDTLAAMKRAQATLAQAPEPAAPAPVAGSGGFLLPDAFSNPSHTQYAIKTTAAAMFCYLFYSATSWPGIHTCLITCYIVSLGTLAESIQKLLLRIAGCLVGAALGLLTMIFLIPHVTALGPYLLLLFLGALPAMWIAAGSERIAYAGFQIAFAFFLCVIQGSGPAFDMVVARDRVIGILLGITVVFVISSCLWPVSVRARVEAAADELLDKLSLLARSDSLPNRRKLVAEAHRIEGAIEADLELARIEPAWVRPPLDWLSARSRALQRSGKLLLALGVLSELQPTQPGDAAMPVSAPPSEALLALVDERLDPPPDASASRPEPKEVSLGSA